MIVTALSLALLFIVLNPFEKVAQALIFIRDQNDAWSEEEQRGEPEDLAWVEQVFAYKALARSHRWKLECAILLTTTILVVAWATEHLLIWCCIYVIFFALMRDDPRASLNHPRRVFGPDPGEADEEALQ